jgi:hypothetical protein
MEPTLFTGWIYDYLLPLFLLSKSEYLFMNGKIIARFGKKIIPDVEPTDTGSLPWLMLLLDNEDN